MKKLFIALNAIVITTALSFSMLAQNNNQRINPKPPVTTVGQKVSLQCKPGSGKDVSTPLYVKNPTGQDLPSGVVVHWSSVAGGTATGKETTTAALQKNNGNEIKLLGPAGNQGSCQAWVIK